MFYGEPEWKHKRKVLKLFIGKAEIESMRGDEGGHERLREGFKCEESGEWEMSCHSSHRKGGKNNGRERNRRERSWSRIMGESQIIHRSVCVGPLFEGIKLKIRVLGTICTSHGFRNLT